MDESEVDDLDMAALTGLLVPVEKYAVVRDDLCRLIWDIVKTDSGVVSPPIELHGRDLLPAYPDCAKIRLLSQIVKLVNKHELHIFSVGYTNHIEINNCCDRLIKPASYDPKLYTHNFFNIVTFLKEIMADTLILPVMDGVPSQKSGKSKPPPIDQKLIRAFAETVRFVHHRRSGGYGPSLSVENAENLAEPLFADSQYSTMIQLVDLVSYLLTKLDRQEMRPNCNFTKFQNAVLRCASKFNPRLVHKWRGKMEIGAPE